MKRNILIVDDEPEIANTLSRYLKLDKNLRVEATTNPLEALERIKQGKMDIIISDIMMPEMDGIALLKRIKQIDGQAQVIMITAYSTLDRAISCLSNGANDLLLKPFESLEEVKRIVDITLEKIERWRKIVIKSNKVEKGREKK